MTDLQDSFIELINQNLGIAHKVARLYFEDQKDREDVMQEMMYQLWRSFETFDGKSKFSTWMYRVCLNTSLTFRRKGQKHKHEPLTHLHAIVEEPAANQEDAINLLYRAIAKLTSLNKAIILLYLEDVSYDEISSITGLTKSNVSVRIVRIKKELEQIMNVMSKTSEHANLR